MYVCIPFIPKEEESSVCNEITGKRLSIIFDGTFRLGEALAIIVRYLNDWKIEQ